MMFKFINFKKELGEGETQVSNCRSFRRVFTAFVVILIGVQLIVDTAFENVIAVCVSGMCALLTVWLVVRPRYFNNTKISAFAVLFYAFLNFLCPLVFTLMEGRSLTYRLQEPVMVFIYLGISTLVLLLSLLVYMHFFSGLRGGFQRLVYRFGFFNAPNNRVLMIGAFFGFCSVIYAFLIADDRGVSVSGVRGVLGKVMDGFRPFVFLPVLYLFPKLIGRKKLTLIYAAIAIVTLVPILGVALAGNYRGILGIYLISIMMLWFWGCLIGVISYTKIPIALRVLVCVLVVSGTFLFGRLATAMEMARSDRGNVNKIEMLSNSVYNFFDGKRIYEHRAMLAENSFKEGWSEAYLLNPLYNRLININFNDNIFHLSEWVTPAVSEQLREFSQDRFWAVLPNPILGRLGLSVDKDRVYSVSTGSYVLYVTTGNLDGNFKTGAMVPVGLLQYGQYFWIYFFAASLVVYLILDAFINPKYNPGFGVSAGSGFLAVSPIILLLIYPVAVTFQAESLLDMLGVNMRVFFQSVLFYWFLNLIFGGRERLEN